MGFWMVKMNSTKASTMPSNLVLFDIDGCVLEPAPQRLEAVKRQDWLAYHAAHVYDMPIPGGVAVYKSMLANPDLRCIFLTDRSEANRGYTQAQLDSIGFGGVPLLMRDRNRKRLDVDGAQSKVMTLELAGYTVEEVLVVFEDRQEIVDHWRSLGVLAYQTKAAQTHIL